jgi:raffinose/stachyose/melibiose transport system substrate-binding protein
MLKEESMKLYKGLIAASVGALALGLAACAGGAAPQNSGGGGGASGSNTLTFRSWSPIEQTTAKMVSTFEADNPGSKIDATIVNYPEYLVDLQTRANSNTFPDLVGLQPDALTQQ